MILKPFKSILDFIKAFPNDESCIEFLEKVRWENGPVSPFDKESKVYTCKGKKYKCKNTGKYFTVATKSIFEGTKLPLTIWFAAIYLLSIDKKGISSYQLAEELGITQKSAWHLLHKIRLGMENNSYFESDNGIICMDETYVGGKNKNRHRDKKVKHSQGRSYKDKTPIFGILQDNKEVRCFVVPDTKATTLQPIIRDVVQENSLIVTDEWCAYDGICKDYHHEVLFHNRGLYINEDGFSSNPIENFWSHFKRGWISTYSGRIQPKHLGKYADEFAFKYNHRKSDLSGKIVTIIKGAFDKRLKYETLIAK